MTCAGPSLPDDEDVLRGITAAVYDAGKGRMMRGAFDKPCRSVSRLAISTRAAIETLFVAELHRPPANRLLFVLEMNVGRICSISISGTNLPRTDVVATPTAANPAHADMTEPLSKSQVSRLLRESQQHVLLPQTRAML